MVALFDAAEQSFETHRCFISKCLTPSFAIFFFPTDEDLQTFRTKSHVFGENLVLMSLIDFVSCRLSESDFIKMFREEFLHWIGEC